MNHKNYFLECHLRNYIIKLRKFGNMGSTKMCHGKRDGTFFYGDNDEILLIFPDSRNLRYTVNHLLGIWGKLLDYLRIELWCYAYYEELILVDERI